MSSRASEKYTKKLENDFLKRGLFLMDRHHLYNPNEIFDTKSSNWRHFKGFFGVSPGVCADAWEILEKNMDIGKGTKRQFLWGCFILKVYATEEVMAKVLKVDEKTMRKWGWHFIKLLDAIDYFVVSSFHLYNFNFVCFVRLFNVTNLCFNCQIEYESRFEKDSGNCALMSIDCTDCRVNISRGRAVRKSRWFSYKSKKPALRYEVGLCIKTGEICWLHGPFPAGAYNDITIFRSALKQHLDDYELVECDDGYQGEDPIKCLIPKFCDMFDDDNMQEARYRVRSRHENVNKRLKQFHILDGVFRSDIEKHSPVF